MLDDMPIVVKAKVSILTTRVVLDANACSPLNAFLHTLVLLRAQDEVRAAWLDEDGQDEGLLRIDHLVTIYLKYLAIAQVLLSEQLVWCFQDLRPVVKLHIALLLANESFDPFFLLGCLQVLVFCEFEFIFGSLEGLLTEVGVLSDFIDELAEAEEWSTLPISAITEQDGYMLIFHVVRIVLSNQVDYPGLLIRLNIDVIVGVVNADFLVPQHQCEYPVAAMPASCLFKLLIEAPLSASLLEILVAEDARDGQILLVTT